MSTIDERLAGLDIALPDVMPPVVDGYVPPFAPFVRSGDQMLRKLTPPEEGVVDQLSVCRH
jgi:hypothetical protein